MTETSVPAAMGQPDSSVSLAVILATDVTGVSQRSISSTAC